MTQFYLSRIVLSFAMFFTTIACMAQIDLLKKGGKLLEKSPTKLLEKYFNQSPVTTSFDDAKTEVMLLGDFDPSETTFLPLSLLEQNEEGNYMVTEGLYSGMNKSFCLKAGTYGPSGGDGHLLAPLEGPKAYIIQNLLENWLTKAPDIPQSNVQQLVWAIIARTDVDKMDNKYKLTLARLLDKEDLAKLAANSFKDKVMEAGLEKVRDQIPAPVYKVIEAERSLRSLYSRADATYEDMERLAILAGVAPAEDMIRPVSKARWSYHPNGFFIRLSPHGYSSTKVDVYIPSAVTAETDAKGRIVSLSYLNTKLIAFSYSDNVNTQGSSNASVINEIIFMLHPQKESVKLTLDSQLDFVGEDFSFASEGNQGSTLQQFTRLLNMENQFLSIEVGQAGKSKLFNLYNANVFFANLPASAIDAGSRSIIRYMLNEAYNYMVYKNIVVTDGKAFHENPFDRNMILKNNSGPFVNVMNGSASVLSDGGYFKQDRGELDLPGTVATPANRSAQRIGQSQPPKDPPWYESLPPCPCSYKAAQDSAKKKGSGWSDCGKANQDYHFGATTEVRWIPPKAGMPGQQCTYDAAGNLITSGIGAGSPDKVSPQSCGTSDISLSAAAAFPGHFIKDMMTFSSKPCWQYLGEWPANNAEKCKENGVSDIDHMKELVGDMTCPEVTELLNAASKSKTISDKLRNYLLGNGESLSPTEAIQEFNKWEAKEGCPGKGVCDVIAEAKSNL